MALQWCWCHRPGLPVSDRPISSDLMMLAVITTLASDGEPPGARSRLAAIGFVGQGRQQTVIGVQHDFDFTDRGLETRQGRQ
jgi:hypothetical protein